MKNKIIAVIAAFVSLSLTFCSKAPDSNTTSPTDNGQVQTDISKDVPVPSEDSPTQNEDADGFSADTTDKAGDSISGDNTTATPTTEAFEITEGTSDVPVIDTTKTPEETEPLLPTISFVGCGDNIIYYGNVRDAQSLSDGTRAYNFKPMFENVSDIIISADIAFINQETVMAGDGYSLSYYPRFNSPRDLGYDLCELGYDVVNIANNHMLDKGADGLSRTIEFWKGMDCLMIGGYENVEDFETVRIIEREGIKIAFLSYTYATNGIAKPASSPLVIPYINDDDITRGIAAAKEVADFVIVSVHWGDEGAFKPNSAQKNTAQLIADCGADVIIGHHPHVIQPIEWLYGKDGNKTLCVYSLGNFAAEQAYDYNMVGGMISFDIVCAGSRPYVDNVVFMPTVYHFNGSFYNNSVYLMRDYTKELADTHGVRRAYGRAFKLETLEKYVRDTVSEEFLGGW